VTETCDDVPPCGCCLPGDPAGARAGHAAGCAAPAFPNLITHVETTDATVTGNVMTGTVDDALAEKGLAPAGHYLDSGYLSALIVVQEAARRGIALIGPLLAGTSAQARAGNGYARAGFSAGYDAQQVTCPQGKTSASWSPCTQHGKDAIAASFAADCGPCPARDRCTKGKRRQISVPPRDLARAQAGARAAEKTRSFQADYARRARYRGMKKTRLDHALMAVALNLLRLHAYWNGHPLDRQRTSHLARLELNLAA
jgi:hypothetical protein